MRREPCGSLGSLASIIRSANEPADISHEVACQRNAAVNKHIVSLGFLPVDVTGDGNCYFRAISVALYGDELHHVELRSKIAQHIATNGNIIFANFCKHDDSALFKSLALNTSISGSWPGEDVIKASAHYLQRQVFIYTASPTSPLIYEPIANLAEPLRLGFYEPGHYQAVVSAHQSASSDVIGSSPLNF